MMNIKLMNIKRATAQYEEWLSQQTTIVQSDLDYKHKQMRAGTFPFLRATFYRWVQMWPQICPELATAPVVLAIGDIHIENFGTWRDQEGRLIWGVNDFDEAYPLPYTQDLVRLATSAGLDMARGHPNLTLAQACNAILAGYRDGLEAGGKPFTLAETHGWLREIAHANLRDPVLFWQKIDALPDYPLPLSKDAVKTLMAALPEKNLPMRAVHRRSGLGSLGRQRIVALATWRGGRVAREIKALVPSACHLWYPIDKRPQVELYETALRHAIRCPDPYMHLDAPWVVRRLAPDCCRVELSKMPDERAAQRLLNAMGYEVANVHLGSADAIFSVQHDFRRRPAGWLQSAAEAMMQITLRDRKEWRDGNSTTKKQPR